MITIALPEVKPAGSAQQQLFAVIPRIAAVSQDDISHSGC